MWQKIWAWLGLSMLHHCLKWYEARTAYSLTHSSNAVTNAYQYVSCRSQLLQQTKQKHCPLSITAHTSFINSHSTIGLLLSQRTAVASSSETTIESRLAQNGTPSAILITLPKHHRTPYTYSPLTPVNYNLATTKITKKQEAQLSRK